MIQETLYTYLGDNGTVTTPVHLDGVPAVKRIRLKADKGMILTNGSIKEPSVTVAEGDLPLWKEIKA